MTGCFLLFFFNWTGNKRIGWFFLQQDRKEDDRLLRSPTEPERIRQDTFFSNRTGYVVCGLALEGLEGLYQEVLQVLKKTSFNFQALFETYPKHWDKVYRGECTVCNNSTRQRCAKFASCMNAFTDGFKAETRVHQIAILCFKDCDLRYSGFCDI